MFLCLGLLTIKSPLTMSSSSFHPSQNSSTFGRNCKQIRFACPEINSRTKSQLVVFGKYQLLLYSSFSWTCLSYLLFPCPLNSSECDCRQSNITEHRDILNRVDWIHIFAAKGECSPFLLFKLRRFKRFHLSRRSSNGSSRFMNNSFVPCCRTIASMIPRLEW